MADWPAVASELGQGSAYSRRMVEILLRPASRSWGVLQYAPTDQIPAEGLGPLYECLAWLEQPDGTPPVEWVRLGGRSLSLSKGSKMYFPSPRLGNVTLAEWAFVDMAWQLREYFSRQKQPDRALEWTVKMCAYLLRPLDRKVRPWDANTYQGDRREKFNTAIAEARMPLWEKYMTREIAQAAAIYVQGCKLDLARRYPSLWPKNPYETIEDLAQRAKRQRPEPKRWIDLARKLAGGKFGDFEATMYTHLHTILEEVADQVRENKKREREEQIRRMQMRR